MELRKSAFARIYSADKNIAIFLGRPPRMNKRFCHFQIPSCQIESPLHGGANDWDPETKPGYRADTRWSAICAFLKEEVWELLQDKQDASCAEKARYTPVPSHRVYTNGTKQLLPVSSNEKPRNTGKPYQPIFDWRLH